MKECEGAIHPAAAEGIRLFNQGEYFEAHEALEVAWRAEPGAIRDLYRGILQVAVTYLHITRNNYDGAVKVFGRSQRWMRDWPEICRGIEIGRLRRDAVDAMAQVERLGRDHLSAFDRAWLKPILTNHD